MTVIYFSFAGAFIATVFLTLVCLKLHDIFEQRRLRERRFRSSKLRRALRQAARDE